MTDDLIKQLCDYVGKAFAPPIAKRYLGEAVTRIEQQAARIAALEAQLATVAPAVDALATGVVGFRTRQPGFAWVPWLTDDQETIRKAIQDAIDHGAEGEALYANPAPSPKAPAPSVEQSLTDEQRATLSRLAMILEAGQAENGIDPVRAQMYASALHALLSVLS